MSSYVNCLGGRCLHMPFFIGGHMSGGGGGEMSYTRPAREMPFKWHFAGMPMMNRH